MKKSRMEAFSDGVIAIIITIMVLELKVPRGSGSDGINALIPLLPSFLSYLLSFIYVGIYWNNHHHMIYTVDTINGKALWANLNLLFWLSLVPFVTEWMGDSHFAAWPVVTYGAVLLMNALAYTTLSIVLINHSGRQSTLAKATGKDWKGKLSILIYIIAMITAYYYRWVGLALYWVVALIWLMPDPRIEQNINKNAHQ